MAAYELAPRITVDPEVRFGKPVIKGTRVAVATVVGHLAGGMTRVFEHAQFHQAIIVSGGKDFFAFGCVFVVSL